MNVPSGHKLVRILKATTYAYEELPRGRVAVLVDAEAEKLVRAKVAEFVVEPPPRAMIATSCPRCGSAMQYVAEPAPSESWTQCQGCGHGWQR